MIGMILRSPAGLNSFDVIDRVCFMSMSVAEPPPGQAGAAAPGLPATASPPPPRPPSSPASPPALRRPAFSKNARCREEEHASTEQWSIHAVGRAVGIRIRGRQPIKPKAQASSQVTKPNFYFFPKSISSSSSSDLLAGWLRRRRLAGVQGLRGNRPGRGAVACGAGAQGAAARRAGGGRLLRCEGWRSRHDEETAALENLEILENARTGGLTGTNFHLQHSLSDSNPHSNYQPIRGSSSFRPLANAND